MAQKLNNYIIKPAEGVGYFDGLAFKGKPKKLTTEYYPSLTVDDLKNSTIHLILKPKSFYYEIYRVNIPTYNKQTIALRLKDRVDTQGFMTGPYRLFWQVLERSEHLFTVFLLAIPATEIDPIIAPLKEVAKAKIRFLSFLPFLLATLSDTEPCIVLHKEKEGVWLTLSENLTPYYVEFIPVDEMVGIDFANLSSRISFFQRLYRGDTGKEVNVLKVTSEELKKGLEELGVEAISLAENFNLYLTVFEISSKFNLLSEEELSVLRLMETNKKIAYGMFALSIVLFMLFGAFWYWNKNIERAILQKENLLSQNINQMLSQYPSEKVKEFQNYLMRRNELQGFPQVSEILYNLVNIDSDYTIEELMVNRVDKNYQISFLLQKKVEPDSMTNVYQNILNKIGSFLIINNSTTQYNIENKTLSLQIQGTIRAKR